METPENPDTVSTEKTVEDQVDLLEGAMAEGHEAFIRGDFLEDNPHEEEDYLSEAWTNGWSGAYDSMVLSSLVVTAKKLVESETPDEVDFYFSELNGACLALNSDIYEEFSSFFSVCTTPDEE